MKTFNSITLIALFFITSPLWGMRTSKKNYRCLRKYQNISVCIGEKVSTLPGKNMRTKRLTPYRYGIVKRVYRDKKLGNYALIFWRNGRKEKISFKRFFTQKEVKQLKLNARGNIRRINMLPRF